MVRRRKSRITLIPAVVTDENTIETQVERDRIKELQLKTRPRSGSSLYKFKVLENLGTERGEHRPKSAQSRTESLSSELSVLSRVSLYSKHEKNGKQELSSVDVNKAPDIEHHNAATNESLTYNHISNNAGDILMTERNADGVEKYPYITLEELKQLTEDTGGIDIGQNLIVHNYLQHLDNAVQCIPPNGLDIKETYSGNGKFKDEILEVASENYISCYSNLGLRRKSSLRKKSVDETNKTSVSFQIQDNNQRRRIKSAGLIHDLKTSTSEHVIRPSSAAHKVSLKPDTIIETAMRLINETSSNCSDPRTGQTSSCVDQNGISNELQDRKRKTSAVSKHSETSIGSRRKSTSANFDPELEKASVYIHGGEKHFSRANTSLMPLKYGLKHLQMNYSENNLEHNKSLIFKDLLKNSCNKSQLRCVEIRNVEKRLERRRRNPLYSTTFYEHKNIVDPYRVQVKKVARTVAQKKKERKEKIKKKSDEISTGYVPTCLTIRIADRQEVEHIGLNCRYLRCSPPTPTPTLCKSNGSSSMNIDILETSGSKVEQNSYRSS